MAEELNLTLLKSLIPGLHKDAQAGDAGARRELVRVLGLVDEMERRRDAGLSKDGAFPASPNTPGQGESEAAFERLRRNERVLQADWWDDYRRLRLEGWDWRKAVYMAWAASPAVDRWPGTQEELAQTCLGLRTDRVIRTWKAKFPEMEERIVKLQAEPLMRHRRDVIEALVEVAKTPDPKAHQDRRMFLEITGDYRATGSLAVSMTPISFIEVAEDDDGA